MIMAEGYRVGTVVDIDSSLYCRLDPESRTLLLNSGERTPRGQILQKLLESPKLGRCLWGPRGLWTWFLLDWLVR